MAAPTASPVIHEPGGGASCCEQINTEEEAQTDNKESRQRGNSVEKVLHKWLTARLGRKSQVDAEEEVTRRSSARREALQNLAQRHEHASLRRREWRFWFLEDVATWNELLEQGLTHEAVVQRLSSYHQNVGLLAAFMSTAVCTTLFDREWDFATTLAEYPGTTPSHPFPLLRAFVEHCTRRALPCTHLTAWHAPRASLLILLVLCVIVDNTVQRIPGAFYLRNYLRAFGSTLSAILPLALLSVLLLGIHLGAQLLMHCNYHYSTLIVAGSSAVVVIVVARVKVMTTRFLQDATRHFTSCHLAGAVAGLREPGVVSRKASQANRSTSIAAGSQSADSRKHSAS
eukprot:6736329-Prymnesium_polylepis.1